MRLHLGVSSEVITPALGLPLCGYGCDAPSDAVRDDLYVKAYVFSYGEARALLIGADLLCFSNSLSDRLRKLCGEAADVPASNVILSATHTHSGPDTVEDIDADYLENILIPRFVSAVGKAAAVARPVTMGVAAVDSNVGINRREILAGDEVILGNNPWGTYDPEMTVVSFKGENGVTVGNIIHYGAHCTVSGSGTVITRDWAGVMADRLATESGGAVTAFFNGAMGDVAPRSARGDSTADISHVPELGGLAGIDAVRAYRSIRRYCSEDMAVATDDVRIPYEVADGSAEPDPADFSYQLTVVRIGPVVFVPTPFEVFSQLSLRLRTYSPFGHTLILGCANGFNMYLPSRDQLALGGYEVDSFRRWSLPDKLPDNTDSMVINQSIKVVMGLCP